MEAAGWTSGYTASDSSVELDRYETVVKDGRAKGRKKYLTYHATAILGLQVVLDSRITSGDTHGTKVPGQVPESMKEQGLGVGKNSTCWAWIFTACVESADFHRFALLRRRRWLHLSVIGINRLQTAS